MSSKTIVSYPGNLENLSWSVRFGRWYRHRRDTIIAWTFLTPMVIYFVFMTFVPLLLLIGISFTTWNLISPPQWVGFKNITFISCEKCSFSQIKKGTCT